MADAREYPKLVGGMDQGGRIICSLIEALLRQEGIQFQYVTHRVKAADSAQRKLSLKSDRYKGLGDLTDLLGVRIITYFPRDVDKVADIIRKEFTIDEENSVDKRKQLDPDRFGYLSIHVIASINKERSRLVEYKQFADIKFEIQVRSILQHAWAEIEHDLGYKSAGAIPDEMRRSFSRLAGILELADEEFERLRAGLDEYEERVQQTITTSPQILPIDQSTLMAAVESEAIIKQLDGAIAAIDKVVVASNIDQTYLGNRATDLKILGLKNLDELLRAMDHYDAYIRVFAEKWLARINGTAARTEFPQGVSLFYLGYILAAQRDDVEATQWLGSIGGRGKIIKDMYRVWKQVVAELGEPKRFPMRTK
ncbi:hypothetical protein KI440_02480 [Candidatus Saccharibacteria bacterium TM7i]|nr:hypothetical protein KI440_02480 [Candidatus Saccharibacteria bacterium TM7i]